MTGGEAALLERLAGGASVVILDNCEHVVDAAAALAVRLLDAAPALRILCTSQVPLDVEGEAVVELAPLALADAVELFTRRATRRPAGGDDAVQELCRSLDGLPLAIELAAARTRTLSIEEISRRLDDRFSVLSDPASRRPQRRRALKATIGWSYELLFPDDKRGLWALAPFAGGAPLPAVESVLEALDVPAAAAIDVVGRLASRSLVIVDGDVPSATGCWTASARSRSRRSRSRGCPTAPSARTPRGSRTRPGPRPPACAATGRPSTSRSRGPSERTSTPPWPGPRRTIRCSGSTSSTASAGPGSCWATAGARSGSWRRSTPRARRLPGRPAPGPCCSRRGSRRRPVTSSSPASTSRRPPRWPRRPATSSCGRAVATTSPTSSRTMASSPRRWS